MELESPYSRYSRLITPPRFDKVSSQPLTIAAVHRRPSGTVAALLHINMLPFASKHIVVTHARTLALTSIFPVAVTQEPKEPSSLSRWPGESLAM